KVVGFGHQLIKALIPPPPEAPDSPAAQPGPRIMHGADAAPFQALRAKMETEWTPQMMEVLGIDRQSLPIIWDAMMSACGSNRLTSFSLAGTISPFSTDTSSTWRPAKAD